PDRRLSFHPPSLSSASTLSLHDALPIFDRSSDERIDLCGLGYVAATGRDSLRLGGERRKGLGVDVGGHDMGACSSESSRDRGSEDRKSTRLNSSHVKISYAVFCLKKKTH